MPQKNPHEKYMEAAQMEADAMNIHAASAGLGNPLGQPGPGEHAAEEQSPLLENREQWCREHLCPQCTEKTEADGLRLRALAEMENFKKRLTREHDEQLRYAAERVLADLLPTLDNLDLALQYGSRHEACKDMLMGVEMTRKLLLDAVRQHGLEAVGEVGEVFNPEWHEGISFDMRKDMDEGLVSTVLQRGYKLKDRLLRPAKVSISKHGAD